MDGARARLSKETGVSDEEYPIVYETFQTEPAQSGKQANSLKITHPADLVPDPVSLGTAYHEALGEVHHRRGTALPRFGYLSQVQEKAYWAFFGALKDACI